MTDDLQLDDEELVANHSRDAAVDEARRHMRWVLIVTLAGLCALLVGLVVVAAAS